MLTELKMEDEIISIFSPLMLSNEQKSVLIHTFEFLMPAKPSIHILLIHSSDDADGEFEGYANIYRLFPYNLD